VAFIIVYLILLTLANITKKVKLSINSSTVEIKVGDLFKEPDFIVISFNEYFDTDIKAANIADRSLNGVFIKNYVTDIQALDDEIRSDSRLNDRIEGENTTRCSGKKLRYRLGSIHVRDRFILTAISRYDDKNCANLPTTRDFVNFLMEFWAETDTVINGRSLAIPLFGSRFLRIHDNREITPQSILELILLSLKASRISIKPPAKITIVIDEERAKLIDFYELGHRYKTIA
jgi:hypothetical protein